MMRGVMAFSIVLAVAIFMILPYFLSGLLKPLIPSYHIRTVIEGFVRIGIFSYIYYADFQNGRYTENVYVPWGRA